MKLIMENWNRFINEHDQSSYRDPLDDLTAGEGPKGRWQSDHLEGFSPDELTHLETILSQLQPELQPDLLKSAAEGHQGRVHLQQHLAHALDFDGQEAYGALMDLGNEGAEIVQALIDLSQRATGV